MSTNDRQEKKYSFERSEALLQRKIILKLEQDGWYVIKLIQTNKNGLPDLMALKDGKVIFLEIKKPGKIPRPLQYFRLRELTDLGFKADYIDKWEDFLCL
jgi:Holliday junction resolvase